MFFLLRSYFCFCIFTFSWPMAGGARPTSSTGRPSPCARSPCSRLRSPAASASRSASRWWRRDATACPPSSAPSLAASGSSPSKTGCWKYGRSGRVRRELICSKTFNVDIKRMLWPGRPKMDSYLFFQIGPRRFTSN